MQYVLTAAALVLVVASAILSQGYTTVVVWSVAALILAWCAAAWKNRASSLTATALFIVAGVRLLLIRDVFSHNLLQGYTVFFNERALACAVLAGSLAGAAVLYKRLDDKESVLFRKAFYYGWVVAVFLLLTVETSDYVLGVMGRVPTQTRLALTLYRRMVLVSIWMVYSAPLLWFGLRKQISPLFLSGIAIVAVAVGLGATWGISYSPIEKFVPFTNIRAAALAFLVVGVILHAQWLAGARRRYHRLEALMHFTWGFLLLELVTVETNDYFRRLIDFSQGADKAGLAAARLLTLAAVWMVLSLPLVRLGLARKMKPTMYLGLWCLLLSLGMSVIRGISFDPIEKFVPVLNFRTFVLAMIIVGGFVQARWIKYSGQLYGALFEILNALRVALALMVLVIVTAEVRDYFEHAKYLLYEHGGTAASPDNMLAVQKLEQFSLSGAWLVFSILLMLIGFKRRVLNLRVIAIPVFAVALIKILVYDVSSFELAYRVLSIVALAAFAVGGYFIFRRYRNVLLDATTIMDSQKGHDHIVY